MQFRTTILQTGPTATGIHVPDDVVAALGHGKRPPVRVTLNGYAYRSTIATMGGAFMVGVSADVREHAHVSGGQELDVEITVDDAPREVSVPDDLAAALEAAPAAKAFFNGLSYSRKQWYVLPVEGAKSPETRARRVSRAVEMLLEGRLP